jgi:hypothetical protein
MKEQRYKKKLYLQKHLQNSNYMVINKKNIFWGSISTGLMIMGIFALSQLQSKDEENVEINYPTYYNNTVASPKMPTNLYFAGEQVPLNVYWVTENLEKELIIVAYQHSKTLQIIKRTPRFFPQIEQILKEEGVPEDFKYLCVAESGLENVVSPAKAAGYWQFLEKTATGYGLTVNEDIDERYHLEKSTKAACLYLKSAKQRLGSWILAAAAYNMGESGILKAVQKQTDNYWDLLLNSETARYVYRLLAYKLVFENPQDYGIKLKLDELYYPVPTMPFAVDTPIENLINFATTHQVSYLELKTLNPWLRNNKLTVGYKDKIIQIPVKPKSSSIELMYSLKHPNEMWGK